MIIDKNIVILFGFSFMAGLFNALMDTIRYHHHYWIFYKIWEWNENVYWWLESEYKPGRKFYLWFLWDGWHCFKTLMIASLMAGFYFAHDKWSFLIFVIGWGLGFNMVFEGFRIGHEMHRRLAKKHAEARA